MLNCPNLWRRAPRVALALVALAFLPLAAQAADPIRIGFSMGLTGANAPNGKQLLEALEIWRSDVNAKGGLLGRPVEFVYYDDQTLPPNEPAIYTKLIEVDKVDLLLGPYGTNQIAAGLPVIMQHKMTTIGILGTAANHALHYPNYFAMVPLGEDPLHAFSSGFFEIAKATKPKLKTIALVGVDAEFGKSMIYVTNEDKPGFIGAFASLLGDAKINIATFHLGRNKQGGDAIALVEIDGAVPSDVLAKVQTLPQVRQAKALRF